jgi:hypothetical protein
MLVRHFDKKPRQRISERAIGRPCAGAPRGALRFLRNVRVAGAPFLISAMVRTPSAMEFAVRAAVSMSWFRQLAVSRLSRHAEHDLPLPNTLDGMILARSYREVGGRSV